MKYILIFSLLWIAEMHSLRTRNINEASPFLRIKQQTSEQKKMDIEICAKELGMPVFNNEAVYSMIEFITYFYPGPKSDENMCMTRCLVEKKAEFLGLKLHELLIKQIDFVYAMGKGSPKVSSEQLKLRINDCHAKESNGCQFYKCLDVLNPPFAHLGASILKPYIVNAVRLTFG